MLDKDLKWALAILLSLVLSAPSLAAPLKPRIIVLTDISPNNVEPDDMESMIRLLVHADLFEIEGLVATTGWSNSGGQERPDLIHEAINAYEKDLRFLWDESAWTYQNGTGKANWDRYAAEIQGHGHLGSMYPKYRYGVEGDTPSFLYVLPNGLNNPENPGHGGWGGYFTWGTGPDRTTAAYINQQGAAAHSVSRKYETRFYPAIFNNFAVRMDWAKNGSGNRNPVVVVNGDSSLANITVTPMPGASVALDAAASYDPDGGTLTFSWWVLPEAGTYTRDVIISGSDSSRATIEVPPDSAGKSFHVICEVTDTGTPRLTRYQRVIVEVKP